MDFSKINLQAASEQGADCQLRHPITGELLFDKDGDPVSVTILGQDSVTFRRAVASANAHQDPGRKKPLTPEANEEAAIEMLAKICIGWNGVEWEEKPLEFNAKNIRMILKKFPPIRAQLDSFVADRGNFFKTAEAQ